MGRIRRNLALAVAVSASACTAVSVSPPLTSRAPTAKVDDHSVAVTSGQFRRPYRVVGVIQMTQSGYRWMHEVEVVSDANPGSILYKIAREANRLGADGVQFLELVDLKPQSPGEKTAKQIDSAVRLASKAQKGTLSAGDVASEGSETRWEVRGELVRFTR